MFHKFQLLYINNVVSQVVYNAVRGRIVWQSYESMGSGN